MNTKVLLAALAGGIANFLVGWLVYGIILDPLLRGMMTPEGQAVVRNPPIIGGIFGSCLVWALLLALIYNRWAGISTLKTGAIAGAVIGLLTALSFDLGIYSMWNMSNINMIFIDPIGSAVVGAVTGGVVGWVLGYRQAAA